MTILGVRLMQISRKSEYAIHSLMILAVHSDSEISVDELAMMQKISRTYLAKVMQKMAKAGLVHSNKGFQGGYTLRLSPKEITLAKVVSIFEDQDHFYQCLQQERDCQLEANCIIHRTFAKAYLGMIAELEQVKIADLLIEMTSRNKESLQESTA